MSAYDISPGAMSASSRPAWANRLGIRIRLSSYTHTDAPSSSTTWGARSRSALATRSAHSPGGSMTWSSTEMSPSMAGSLRPRPWAAAGAGQRAGRGQVGAGSPQPAPGYPQGPVDNLGVTTAGGGPP